MNPSHMVFRCIFDRHTSRDNSHLHPQVVGGLEQFLFFYILGIIIPTDSYFSEG